MSGDRIFQEILELFDNIRTIVNNTNWSNYSETRVRILVSQRVDELKHILGEIPDDLLTDTEKASLFFENVLEKITLILTNLPQDKLPIQWYELELFRLRYASMYALQYGQAGELQVAGSAHALANMLIGISTLDVKNLYVDWDHHEFHRRRKLILNYLSSAYLFFFSLCDSLSQIFKHDLEHWMTEGLKASIQYIKYMDMFWNVRKNIELAKKIPKERNYSMYYASFAAIDYIMTFLLDLQRYLYNDSLNIVSNNEVINITNPEDFLNSMENLLKKGDGYVADLQSHVDQGFFDLNDNPLTDEDVSETVYELEVTRAFITGLKASYNVIIKDDMKHIHAIETEVMPKLYEYLDKYKHLMDDPEFINSQMADGIAGMLEELIYFGGILALKMQNYSHIEKVLKEYKYFFSDDGMKRYPKLNGLMTTFETTLITREESFSKLESHAHKLIRLSEYSKYTPRNAFSFALLGNLILTIRKEQTVEDFSRNMKETHEIYYLAFTQKFNSEIEIYLTNLYLALKNEEASYDMRRLVSPQYFDPYSIFIPEFRKFAHMNNFGDVDYLPFNLQSDYIADTDFEIVEQPLIVADEKETIIEQPDSSAD
ncbi:MAG: hypothetical protein GOP50_09825 [Candidatus Heimdallarchaeota archaeon]|nr:hypothetical protein [Candidatus Heimdallarchaeota archaeon]